MIFDFLLKLFLLLTLIHPIFLDASMQFSLKLSKDNLGVNLQNQSELDWNLKGRPGQGYYTSVLIGTPPQQLNVLVDTGSSNFAIAAAENPSIRRYFHYTSSSTFKDLNVHINVPYTQGHWEGNLGSDFITLPNVLNSTVKANVACITESKDFFISTSDWQGILGLAYKEIARPDRSVEPYFDSLIKAGKSDNIFSIQLCGPFGHLYNDTGGVLVLGDIDSSLYLGDVTYTPITREWYYEVVLTSIGVGNDTLDIQCIDLNDDKTIIDSGTTNFRLPTNIFNKLVSSIKKKVKLSKTIPDRFWHGTKMMCWHNAEVIPWEDFPPIKLSLAHAWNSAFTITIAPQQYLRKMFDVDNETASHECYKFAVDESKTGTVLGAVIMEGFYVIFDRKEKRIGFGLSTCARDYLPEPPSISAPFFFNEPIKRCYKNPAKSGDDKLLIVAYVMATICIVLFIPMLFMLMQWIWKNLIKARFKCSDSSSDFAYLVQ